MSLAKSVRRVREVSVLDVARVSSDPPREASKQIN